MDYVMESINADLGVNCMFCHVHYEKGYEYSFDYASDSLRNKRIAREMLRMTIKLNRKYFNNKLTGLMTTRSRFWCKTCHQGKPRSDIHTLIRNYSFTILNWNIFDSVFTFTK